MNNVEKQLLPNKIMGGNLLTVNDVKYMFDVTKNTILNWRRGTDPMPYIEIPGTKRNTVRFDYTKVLAWAKRNEKVVKNTVEN